ncbi:hypothetical protein BU17DRAFT_96035 [Hysterangium stoloniferum]|nr:hypothetical protein BU17DRAFT_96035 [Hysterangium stoloniferum]
MPTNTPPQSDTRTFITLGVFVFLVILFVLMFVWIGTHREGAAALVSSFSTRFGFSHSSPRHDDIRLESISDHSSRQCPDDPPQYVETEQNGLNGATSPYIVSYTLPTRPPPTYQCTRSQSIATQVTP